MREIEALVEHYLREWDSRGWAGAYHSLVELGPRVLPELQTQLAVSRDTRFRAALVELARQMHSADALSLFDVALRDPSPEVWKAALDGLVDLASPASLVLLEEAAEREPPGRTGSSEWEVWVREALQQARAEFEARGGAGFHPGPVLRSPD
jgi:HEAT repeat protein